MQWKWVGKNCVVNLMKSERESYPIAMLAKLTKTRKRKITMPHNTSTDHRIDWANERTNKQFNSKLLDIIHVYFVLYIYLYVACPTICKWISGNAITCFHFWYAVNDFSIYSAIDFMFYGRVHDFQSLALTRSYALTQSHSLNPDFNGTT